MASVKSQTKSDVSMIASTRSSLHNILHKNPYHYLEDMDVEMDLGTDMFPDMLFDSKERMRHLEGEDTNNSSTRLSLTDITDPVQMKPYDRQKIKHNVQQDFKESFKQKNELKYNILCVTGAGGGDSGPGCLYTFLTRYTKYKKFSDVEVMDTNIPNRTLDKMIEKFINTVINMYTKSHLPFVFIGWSMGASIIIQAIERHTWLQELTKSIILISPQTHNTTEIKNFNFNYELMVIHGDNDSVLSYACGQRLFSIATTSNKYLIFIKGGDHTMFNVKHSRALIDIVVDYLNGIFYGSKRSRLFMMKYGSYYV